tara:strand:+ start:207 stop:464 length:258 start_codon:yes stop_codon:yes gene_type:complete
MLTRGAEDWLKFLSLRELNVNRSNLDGLGSCAGNNENLLFFSNVRTSLISKCFVFALKSSFTQFILTLNSSEVGSSPVKLDFKLA